MERKKKGPAVECDAYGDAKPSAAKKGCREKWGGTAGAVMQRSMRGKGGKSGRRNDR